MNVLIILLICLLSCGCTFMGPVTVAWRSNTNQQTAQTDGNNAKAEDANSVNADRKSELQTAVSTSNGTANADGKSKEAK